jgi:DNA-directed RNA polymerase subunit A'
MPSPKRIGKIEFGLLSPKEIREMSVRKIIWADTYDDDGFPYPQGLMDLNLGVIDPGLRCKTCDQKTPPGILPRLREDPALPGRGGEGCRYRR